jgi:hypothetical protein
MTVVWNESRQQAEEMLYTFLGQNNGRTDQTIDGLRQIAINVLASAGYGDSPSWSAGKGTATPGHQLSYVEVLNTLTSGFIVIATVPLGLLSLGFLPQAVQRIAIAAREFPLYAKEALVNQRGLSDNVGESQKTFISSLIRISDELKSQEKSQNHALRPSLSEDEIIGNLFQFTLAGFDTTANTLAYAVTLLAIYPEWQNWIVEEIDQVCNDMADLTYLKIFPRLKRCLVLMASLDPHIFCGTH